MIDKQDAAAVISGAIVQNRGEQMGTMQAIDDAYAILDALARRNLAVNQVDQAVVERRWPYKEQGASEPDGTPRSEPVAARSAVTIDSLIRELLPAELECDLTVEDRFAIARVVVDAVVCGNGFLRFWTEAKAFERQDPATVVVSDARL